ncbi:type II toxin-antitoxin system SpoIISA family toxin [Neobacillus terrae]|uniref:type II toxin-antitoxin system SpoIISA family toxin n=1 Tax=Neobacillus terrae TaxID=3034837 RepID=UPI00140BC539|nr:hypothetical protein [Neobacillus terrae]
MAFKIFVSILLAFSIGNLVFFLVDNMKYHASLRALRKTLYTIFIGAVALGILMDEIKISNWQFLITLTAIVIFIDLSLILTPSIMKIWKAEFQYGDYVENVIEANNKIHRGTMRRVGTMSEMIQNAGTYFEEEAIPEPNAIFERDELEKYLKLYSDQYGFALQLWELAVEPFDANLIPSEERAKMNNEELETYIEDVSLLQAINRLVDDIERLNSFELGNEKEEYVSSLFHSEIISLIKEDSMIVPVYMEQRSMLIVLKNTSGELLEVDAVHITNLIYLFYSFH